MGKRIIPYINAENELDESVRKQVASYISHGAEELCIYNYTMDEQEQEQFLALIKSIIKEVSVPFIIGLCVKRFEDVKKALYTGASRVLLPYRKLANPAVIKEASARFGTDVILVEFDESETGNEGALSDPSLLLKFQQLGIAGVLLKHVSLTAPIIEKIQNAALPIYIRDSLLRNDCSILMGLKNVKGILTDYYGGKDLIKIKQMLLEEGIDVNSFHTDVTFDDLKKDSNGLVTVVVQEERTKEVLMVAYMNEQAYQMTLNTGRMTYYSRSRNELWIKGATSGHYQYMKSLKIDCDNDTLLALVDQTGAACHTGNHSCFYRTLAKTEQKEKAEENVLEEVFKVICDRKENPKEGSYTNYLFQKGIDKILKKCGEEATEIIIAAKNPDPDELKYEFADFLYHMMVLMAERQITWEDILGELKNRE